jgi:hypothetical protein
MFAPRAGKARIVSAAVVFLSYSLPVANAQRIAPRAPRMFPPNQAATMYLANLANQASLMNAASMGYPSNGLLNYVLAYELITGSYGSGGNGGNSYANPSTSPAVTESNFLLNLQEAAMRHEDVRLKRLEFPRKELENRARTREFLHEDWQAERARQAEYGRQSSYDPKLAPAQLVKALNALYEDMQYQSLGSVEPVEIDPGVLDRINFKVNVGDGALLKLTSVPWPVVLREENYARDRERMTEALADAKNQVLQKQLPTAEIQEIDAIKDRLKEDLRMRLLGKADATPIDINEYSQATHVLRQVDDTLRLLHQPNDAAYILSQRPDSKTVADLVFWMNSRGLRFGDIPEGSAPYYRTLHTRMAQQAQRIHGDK